MKASEKGGPVPFRTDKELRQWFGVKPGELVPIHDADKLEEDIRKFEKRRAINFELAAFFLDGLKNESK